MCGAWSTLTFTIRSAPARSRLSWSSAGPTRRHGPHHGAQRSTTTGRVDRSMSRSKSDAVASVSHGRSVLQPAHRGLPRVTIGTRLVRPQAGQTISCLVVTTLPVALDGRSQPSRSDLGERCSQRRPTAPEHEAGCRADDEAERNRPQRLARRERIAWRRQPARWQRGCHDRGRTRLQVGLWWTWLHDGRATGASGGSKVPSGGGCDRVACRSAGALLGQRGDEDGLDRVETVLGLVEHDAGL